jgi:diguanylate cyclase (GGDEF)-like protein/PAS domain S-box-containing protein
MTDRPQPDSARPEGPRQLLEQALQAITQGVVIAGLDRKVIYANEAFTRITGYTESEMLGRTCAILQGAQTDTDAIDSIRTALQQQTEFHGEILNYKKDGEPYWNELTISPMRNVTGETTHFIGINRDISQAKHAELEIHEAQAELLSTAIHSQTILDNMVDGVITISIEGLVESFNKAASYIFGYAPYEVIGNNVSMLMPSPHRTEHDGYLRHYQSTGEARVIGVPREVHGQRNDGKLFPMSLSVSKIKSGEKTTFIGIARDISQRRHDEEEIRRLAYYDPLTALPNRRLLMDRLHQAMLTSARTEQHGALMFLDLDHFKQLNDSLGHDIGDELLKQVARRILECVREGDSVARLGGDEFVILLEALSDQSNEAATQAESVASKVMAALGQPYQLRHHAYSSTPSIGIVIFMEDHETMDELVKKADAAMYQAKSAGRNTIRFFDPVMQEAAATRSALERDLRAGLAQGEFLLLYQMQVNHHGETVGAEALIRWKSPTRGMVSPAQFIPLAEEIGFIIPLGQWVLETGCQQLVAWSQTPKTEGWKLAVNVSALQFAQANFVDSLVAVLNKTGANPKRLKLEITESMLVTDIEMFVEKMNAIRAMGIGFSLDDFGTGYSSLSYLKRLPLYQLKIDQSFVKHLQVDLNDAVIARAIVKLGQSLGLEVIAEGVETAEQLEILLGYGCDAFQGYYFSRPESAEVLTAMPARPLFFAHSE